MKQLVVWFLLVFSKAGAFAQKDSIIYRKEVIKFLNETSLANTEAILGQKVYLSKNPNMGLKNEYFEIIKDSTIKHHIVKTTVSETVFARKMMWDTSFIKNAIVIDLEEIKTNFSSSKNFWEQFYAKYPGNGYYRMSFPFFSNNFNMCTIQIEHLCGGLCGHGYVTIFEKVKGHWKKVKEIKTWIS